MVIKGAQMGIPVLLSRSGVTHMGLEVAQKVGVTLIARAKGRHFLVYSGADNIEFDAIPALSEDFAGMNGTILVQGADQMVNSSADFALPIGKRVFVGRIPNIAIFL